jgi:hypothetical protein
MMERLKQRERRKSLVFDFLVRLCGESLAVKRKSGNHGDILRKEYLSLIG